MSGPTLETKLDRIFECSSTAKGDDITRSLLHAYVACLSFNELVEVAVRTINDLTDIRLAVRNRLARLGRESGNQTQLDRLGQRILAPPAPDAKARVRADALLSHLYEYFSPSVRQKILDHWRSRGTRGAAARWLKALSGDDLLFDIEEVRAHWHETGDARAAKVLVYRSDASLLSEILPELVKACDEGWIIGRAALGAEVVSEESWKAIRSRFPATYAYLCAKTGRSLEDDEAVAIVVEAGETWPSDERGLAIWAIGQLGMWSALERIREMVSELRSADLARIGIRQLPEDNGT